MVYEAIKQIQEDLGRDIRNNHAPIYAKIGDLIMDGDVHPEDFKAILYLFQEKLGFTLTGKLDQVTLRILPTIDDYFNDYDHFWLEMISDLLYLNKVKGLDLNEGYKQSRDLIKQYLPAFKHEHQINTEPTVVNLLTFNALLNNEAINYYYVPDLDLGLNDHVIQKAETVVNMDNNLNIDHVYTVDFQHSVSEYQNGADKPVYESVNQSMSINESIYVKPDILTVADFYNFMREHGISSNNVSFQGLGLDNLDNLYFSGQMHPDKGIVNPVYIVKLPFMSNMSRWTIFNNQALLDDSFVKNGDMECEGIQMLSENNCLLTVSYHLPKQDHTFVYKFNWNQYK